MEFDFYILFGFDYFGSFFIIRDFYIFFKVVDLGSLLYDIEILV